MNAHRRSPLQHAPSVPEVAFICTARASYTRNETLLAGLRQNYAVSPVSSDLATYPRRLIRVAPGALRQLMRADVTVAGFLAQPLAPLLYMRNAAKPLVVDAFISLYETLAEDRKAIGRRSPLAAISHLLDAGVLRRAHRILTDTEANARYLARRFDIEADRFAPVYVGANEELFYPRPVRLDQGPLIIFYYATYLPLHGVDVIVHAASLLSREPNLRVVIVGDGPERPRAERLASESRADNVEFIDSVRYEELPGLIAQAHICLGGHFNARNAKARRVVPGKVFQFLAMGKPTIVGDCPGTREALRHNEDTVFVPMGDPEALAQAILQLRDDSDLRQHIAMGGLRKFRESFSLNATAGHLRDVIDAVTETEVADEAAA